MKKVSLKTDDSIFGETEKILAWIKKPRNRIISFRVTAALLLKIIPIFDRRTSVI